MTEEMIKEILEDWKSWKYDIIELNNSTWTQRDEHKLNTITAILEEQLAWKKAANRR
tara:strand:- start:400 stop:570 length:171 start_codon:yes stop_codon:yes gene_type:complete